MNEFRRFGATRSKAKSTYLSHAMRVVALTALSVVVATAAGGQKTITPGAPSKKGVDRITITRKGKPAFIVPVPVTGSENEAEKLDKVEIALTKAGFVVTRNALGTGLEFDATVTEVKSESGSGEIDDIAWQPLPNDGPVLATIDNHLGSESSALLGLNAAGGPASYVAGLAFTSPTVGSVSLFTTFGFTDLSAPTIDALLLFEFSVFQSQLALQAPSMASALTLDLTAGAIVFRPLASVTSLSVTNGTTDVSLVTTLGVSTAVPEPSTLLLTSLGLAITGWLALGARTGARVGPSTEVRRSG